MTGLYNIFLGRAPDAPGLAGWVNLLKGGMPLAQVATAFANSPALPVAGRRLVLHELPRPGRGPVGDRRLGQLHAAGHTEEQVASLFLSSPAYSALHPDNAGFVQSLYGNVLGSSGSASDVAAWANYLAGGGSRATVVGLFLSAADTRAVYGLSTVILGQPGPSDVIKAWVCGPARWGDAGPGRRGVRLLGQLSSRGRTRPSDDRRTSPRLITRTGRPARIVTAKFPISHWTRPGQTFILPAGSMPIHPYKGDA